MAQETYQSHPHLTDATLRFLRAINSRNGQCFAGNHNCRKMLAEGGYIEATREQGQYWRINLTPKGTEALNG